MFFFRSLSYVITGSEVYHAAMRTTAIQHLEQNQHIFDTKLTEGTIEYVIASKMKQMGTWATEVEIIAAAHLLCTDIYTFTFTGQRHEWLKYSGSIVQPSLISHDKSIYLNHANRNHYEVVLCTQDTEYLFTKSTYDSNEKKVMEQLYYQAKLSSNQSRKHVGAGTVRPTSLSENNKGQSVTKKRKIANEETVPQKPRSSSICASV